MKTKYTYWLTKLQLIIITCLVSLSTGCHFNKEQTTAALGSLAEIHFIDTGNSDAILIKQGNDAALIDGGDNDDEVFISDYIKQQGITAINYLFVTHPDADHIGGLDAVVDAFDVKEVYVGNGKAETKTYRDFIEALMNKGLTPSVPLLHSEFSMASSSFKVLSVAHAKDVNNTSLVLLYTNGNDKVLLMGDADKSIEKNLKIEQAHLIKIGHHGSRTSSDKDFLVNLQPQYAVITVGANNKYGHPHRETMETLKNLNIPVYRTDEGGTIIFQSTGDGITTKAQSHSYRAGIDLKNQVNNSVANRSLQSSPISKGSKVFFTQRGKRYHSIPDCSGMKEPLQGTLEEIGNRTACQKCYEIK